MAGSEEVVLSAWQIYTALFVMFWAVQLYLSSFWMSVICCVKVISLNVQRFTGENISSLSLG